MKNNDLTQSRVKELLEYDERTGVFYWKSDRRQMKAGTVAGNKNAKGYVRIVIDKKSYAAHRLVYMLTYGRWPASELDHINCVKTDNRLDNLREATRSQNLFNQPARKGSRTKVRGVYVCGNKYRVRITTNGRCVNVGCFENKELAELVYSEYARRIAGEFAYSAVGG